MLNYSQLLTDLKQALQIVGVPAVAEPGESFTAGLSRAIGPLPFTDVVDAKMLLPALLSAPVDLQGALVPKVTIAWIVKRNGVQVGHEEGFLAPGGVNKLTLDILMLPEFVPLTMEPPPPVLVEISAEVTITLTVPLLGTSPAQTITEGPFTIGPVQTLLPAIPFPWVLVMTQKPFFAGAALVLVPRGSMVNCVETLRTILAPIQRVLSLVSKVARLAGMLAGIDAISRIINAPHVAFAQADSFSDLNDIDLYGGTVNDIEAEDELSSFVYLAPPRAPVDGDAKKRRNTVTMFIHTDFEGGSLEVGTGVSLVALCRSLEGGSPDIFPAEDEDFLTQPPVGPAIRFPSSSSDYGDELSSIRFNLS